MEVADRYWPALESVSAVLRGCVVVKEPRSLCPQSHSWLSAYLSPYVNHLH